MNNSKVLYWSFVIALGGFLFGFDTAVISGAEQSIQSLWKLDDFTHGLVIAIALYGTVIGAMFGGIPSNIWGRKTTLFWIGILYSVSAIGSALAVDPISFMIFRFIGGLGVGASSVAAPLYIAEISPSESRGRLVALFQFNIVFGILIAFLSNYLLESAGLNWRWMIGLEAFPAIAFTLMVLSVPNSPRWLIVKKNNVERAKLVLAQINPNNVEEEVSAILKAKEHEAKGTEKFFSKRYSKPIMLVIAIAFFNQVSGINAIIYYAPRIFEMTGLGASTALLSTSGIGIVNLVFTLIGMFLIDKLGRKILMIIGSFGLIGTLGLVANAFWTDEFTGVPIMLFVYIAFFAMSQGAVIWVFIGEVFPNNIRAYGQSLGSFTHWILAAIVANTFPMAVSAFSAGGIFMFFSVMMVLQLIFAWKIMPETKGLTLENIEEELVD